MDKYLQNSQKISTFFHSYRIPKIFPTMWGPRWITKLVQITPITMVYGRYNWYNYSYWGESKPTNITGGPHIVWNFSIAKPPRGRDIVVAPPPACAPASWARISKLQVCLYRKSKILRKFWPTTFRTFFSNFFGVGVTLDGSGAIQHDSSVFWANLTTVFSTWEIGKSKMSKSDWWVMSSWVPD